MLSSKLETVNLVNPPNQLLKVECFKHGSCHYLRTVATAVTLLSCEEMHFNKQLLDGSINEEEERTLGISSNFRGEDDQNPMLTLMKKSTGWEL